MLIKLTDQFIRGLTATGQSKAYGDAQCKGLRLRATAKGVLTFVYAYHSPVHHKTVQLTFGRYPDVTLKDARERTDEARRAVAAGTDPQVAKIEARAQKKSELAYADLIVAFMAGKLGKQRTARDREIRLKRVGLAFGWSGRAIGSITDDEAHACITRLAGRGYTNERGRTIGGPVEAFATKSVLGSMWRWAKRNKLVRVNIFADLEVDAATIPGARDRVLTPDEIRTLWAELDRPGDFGFTADAATALRLILATAARPGMVTGMRASELIDIDAPPPRPITFGQLRVVNDDDAGNGPIWQIPHARMKRKNDDKNREPFIVPLNAMAVGMIRAGGGGAEGRVFGSARPTGHMARMKGNDPARLMRAIWKKHGFEYARPHDLRRTAATLVQSAVLPDRPKYSLVEVGWLLSHHGAQSNSVTAVYARYDHFDEKCTMVAVLERELRRLLKMAPAVRGRRAA